MTNVIDPPVSDAPERRSRRRDLAVGTVALLAALFVGWWIGQTTAADVTVTTVCHQIGQPPINGERSTIHVNPGSFVDRECNIK